MLSEMTVCVVRPTTFVVIFWACIKTVSKVCHVCADAAIRGGVPIRVTDIVSLTSELNPGHTGISVLFTS